MDILLSSLLTGIAFAKLNSNLKTPIGQKWFMLNFAKQN